MVEILPYCLNRLYRRLSKLYYILYIIYYILYIIYYILYIIYYLMCKSETVHTHKIMNRRIMVEIRLCSLHDYGIFDFEHSRNQRQCSEFSSPIGFNM